jgi:hypothetical protein
VLLAVGMEGGLLKVSGLRDFKCFLQLGWDDPTLDREEDYLIASTQPMGWVEAIRFNSIHVDDTLLWQGGSD